MTRHISALKLLALDTATEACSVALLNETEVSAQFELAPREHTQRILPMVEELLQSHKIQLKQLDAIVCCLGPGSFTGVRIGIGIVQGLAYGAKLPVLGVSTLAVLAQGAYRQHGASKVLVAIDARMGEVYWAEYQRNEQGQGQWQGAETEAVLSPLQAKQRIQILDGEWTIAGTGWDAYPELFAGHDVILHKSESLLPSAEDMLPLASQLWQQGAITNPAEIEPIYLRNEVTWKKLPGR